MTSPSIQDPSGLFAHDLLRVVGGARLIADGAPPDWVEDALAAAPWVVVRRAGLWDGRVPVGVRGPARNQRWAGWIDADQVEACLRPEALVERLAGVSARRVASLPALAGLGMVAGRLDALGRPWGPTGSTGFELASGRPTVTATSDLDLVIRCEQPMSRSAAAELVRAAGRLDVRCDVLMETPAGGVALLEFARTDGPVAARTVDGPRLVDDPWKGFLTAEVAP
jgi:phosphoribosyl-dephospho-CoA transferase